MYHVLLAKSPSYCTGLFDLRIQGSQSNVDHMKVEWEMSLRPLDLLRAITWSISSNNFFFLSTVSLSLSSGPDNLTLVTPADKYVNMFRSSGIPLVVDSEHKMASVTTAHRACRAPAGESNKHAHTVSLTQTRWLHVVTPPQNLRVAIGIPQQQ